MLLNSPESFDNNSSSDKGDVERKIKFQSQKSQFFKSIGIVNLPLARNLLLLLAIFNLATLGYTKLFVSQNPAPFSESKIINQMVIYHFLSAQFLGLILLVSTCVKEERAARSKMAQITRDGTKENSFD